MNLRGILTHYALLALSLALLLSPFENALGNGPYPMNCVRKWAC
jgi:hypothetical protein